MNRSSFRDIASRMVPLFESLGFARSGEIVADVSDDGAIDMSRADMALRLVRDRRQWFVELRSASDSEWFDSRLALAMIGDTRERTPPKDEAGLRAFVDDLVSTAPKWQRLFDPSTYEETRRVFKEKEREAARRTLGYVDEGDTRGGQ